MVECSPQSAFAATRPGSMVKVLESTPAANRLVTRPKPFSALVIAVAALAAAACLATSPAAVAQTQAAGPCSRGRAVASACQLITRFFDALNRGNQARACSLLGATLLFETGGPRCPRVLSLYQGTPFKIIGVRTVRTTVLIRVELGLHELDHWRVLNWTAIVGTENGTLKICDTKRVA